MDPKDNLTASEELNTPGAVETAPSDDFTRIFTFDPFSEEATPPSGEAPAADADPAVTTAPAAVAPKADETIPATEGAPATPASQPEANAELELLRNQVQEMGRTIQSLQTPQTPPKEAAPATAKAEEIPEFQFTIPPQMLQMMESENPVERQQAIGALMTGVAKGTYQTVMARVEEQLQEVLSQHVPAMITNYTETQRQAQTVFDDFYGTYKDLNRPELRPLIKNTAAILMQETKTMDWSPKFRDALATRVYSILGRQTGAPPVPPPNLSSGSSTRPAAADSVVSDIQTTLFGG